MNPEQRMDFEVKEARHLRTIISIGLVLVLGGIVAAYIYFGMQLARETVPSDVIVETPLEETSPTVDAIEAALKNAPLATPEEVQAIEAALDGTELASPEEVEAIQAALGQPTE